MKTRLILSLSLLAGLLVACAPSAAPTEAEATQANLPVTLTAFADASATQVPTLDQASQPTAGPTQDLAPTPLPIATSRGPELHATDPSTVNLASGGLHFVEFFRFT